MAGNQIRNMGPLARAISSLANRLYQPPANTISNMNPEAWPSPLQPVAPIGPKDSKPLIWPFQYGQNLVYTPRPDALYTATDLMGFATYPLARICIDNSKDAVCKMKWNIRLRKQPGEDEDSIRDRRNKATKSGDEGIAKLTAFFEFPNRDQDWSDFIRRLMEDMLVTDSASILLGRNLKGNEVLEATAIPGWTISRYIDEQGYTPQAPNPAYAQTWYNIPRIDLTTDQLVYRPRNIVPRGDNQSSYLYGLSPTESIAEEIRIGQARLNFVYAFYQSGSMSNMIHVVSNKVEPDRMKEAMQWFNSEVGGNLEARRQYRIIQGFTEDGKDQIIFPEEPVLADTFDDVLIRKICFAYGTSPQRLQKMMNRGSAQISQTAAQEEGIEPWISWSTNLVNYIIQKKMNMPDYEIDFSTDTDVDISKQSKVDQSDVQFGIRSRNEVRRSRGLDPITTNPLADQLTVTTPNGTIPLGQTIVSGKGGDGGGGSPPSKPNGKANGAYTIVQRGEM